MSGAALAISGATAAIGAGVSAYANNQAMRKQDRIAAQGIIRQQGIQDQANGQVQKVVQDAAKNTADVNNARAAQQAQYAAALQRAAPVQGTTAAVPGGSKRYAQSVVDSLAANKTFGNNLAARTAAIDAPSIAALHTQQGIGNAATNLGLLQDTSNNEANLTSMEEKGVQPNPWAGILGSAISGAGQGYAAKYGWDQAGKKAAYDSLGPVQVTAQRI